MPPLYLRHRGHSKSSKYTPSTSDKADKLDEQACLSLPWLMVAMVEPEEVKVPGASRRTTARKPFVLFI